MVVCSIMRNDYVISWYIWYSFVYIWQEILWLGHNIFCTYRTCNYIPLIMDFYVLGVLCTLITMYGNVLLHSAIVDSFVIADIYEIFFMQYAGWTGENIKIQYWNVKKCFVKDLFLFCHHLMQVFQLAMPCSKNNIYFTFHKLFINCHFDQITGIVWAFVLKTCSAVNIKGYWKCRNLLVKFYNWLHLKNYSMVINR